LGLLAVIAVGGVSGCKSDATTCAATADCGEGWICAAAVCRKLCNRNADCWPPEIGCVDGICELAPATSCGSAIDCVGIPTADACSAAGICVCQALGLPCFSHEVCSSGGCVELSSGPSAISPSAGGVAGASTHYRLQLFVAPSSPVGSGSSEQFRLELGPARHSGR
jgi:hypothetical protein